MPSKEIALLENRPLQFSIRTMFIVMAVVGVLLGLFASAVRNARDAAFTSSCNGRLCQLALALHNYHDMYGTFPPARIMGPDGTPWHSWRTLVLPLIEQQGLYQKYRFDEPWNGSSNKALAATVLDCFRCYAGAGPATNTNFVAVAGPGTMWPDEKAMSLSEISDGPENTIMIVEVADSNTHWMEPRDLRIDQMVFEINSTRGNSISSRHFKGAVVAFADGHRELLGPETAAAAIRKWLLVADQANAVNRSK